MKKKYYTIIIRLRNFLLSIMRISHLTFGQSTNLLIVCVHGFQANAGYWLPFISNLNFQRVKLYVLNINYDSLTETSDVSKYISDLLAAQTSTFDKVYIICHSLGSYAASFINQPGLIFIHLAPSFLFSSIDFSGLNEFFDDHLKLEKYIVPFDFDVSVSNHINSFFLIPDCDHLFSYKIPSKIIPRTFYVRANHFNIVDHLSDFSNTFSFPLNH